MRQLVLLPLLVGGFTACSIEAPEGRVGIYGRSADSGVPTPEVPLLFLTMRIRDFKHYDPKDPSTNPDFDEPTPPGATSISEKGVVASVLGSDGTPVYMSPPGGVGTNGKAYFDQWYHDVPGTNYLVIYPLPISRASDGTYEYDSRKSGQADTYLGMARRVFFPIDDGTPYATPFGNQGAPHNQAFTGELHTTFTSGPSGGTVRLLSDDDSYLFIDGMLVIDNGGAHAASEVDISVDDLRLAQGQEHSLDLFYAERRGATGQLMLSTPFELNEAAPIP